MEARAHKLVVEQRRNRAGDSDYFMNNAQYSGGYLHRGFAIKSVNKAQGPPDIEELQRFNQVWLAVLTGLLRVQLDAFSVSMLGWRLAASST